MSELLAPCGSINEINAAIAGGCDAIYLGGKKFNARQSAGNFSDEELVYAIDLCHLNNVKVYVTLNTVISDKEINELIPFIKMLNSNGCDGIIVQSLGLASVIKNIAPSLPVHGSTQLTVHSLKGVEFMAKMGMDRVVLSRELSYENIKFICDNSPIETEVFIHGALCMCYSGQCYLSSVIGARSGNRGSCAQPCRKEYKNGYELSLKDLAMAQNFRKFLSLGVTSFKIEGRLKSKEYVFGVTKTYRSLINERRDANKEEIAFLKSLFSRQGFTNGYFNNSPSKEMFGIRTDEDKKLTSAAEINITEKKIPLNLNYSVKENEPVKISYSILNICVEKLGDIPQKAEKKATVKEDIEEKLTKTGSTVFEVKEIKGEVDSNLFVPLSNLNNLRRQALDELYWKLTQKPLREEKDLTLTLKDNSYSFQGYNITLFDEEKVAALEEFEEKICTLWLPFNKITKNHFNKTGILLPAIIKDNELPFVKNKLKELKLLGIDKTYCRTWDNVNLSKDMGFIPCGGYSLNLFNSYDLGVCQKENLQEAVISPECNFNIIKNLKKEIPLSVIAYGRQIVMVTENCIIKNANCCIDFKGCYGLTDKTNATFPVFCEYPHRNIILNSVPVNLSDKCDELLSLGVEKFDFIFTLETADEIKQILIDFKENNPPQNKFTRGLYFRKI